jgi:hypothetical protein
MMKLLQERFDLTLEFAERLGLHHPQITQISPIRQAEADPTYANPDFSPRVWQGGALQAAEKLETAVILSAAKDLALSIFNARRDSSSPLLLRMTALSSFSAGSFSPAGARPS